MSQLRPRAEWGAFPPGTEHYGRSVLGAPLLWFPAPQALADSGLIIAGTHGDFLRITHPQPGFAPSPRGTGR